MKEEIDVRKVVLGDDTLRKLELLDVAQSPAGTLFLGYGRGGD